MFRYLHTSGALMINICSSAGSAWSRLNRPLDKAVSTALEIIFSSSSLSMVTIIPCMFYFKSAGCSVSIIKYVIANILSREFLFHTTNRIWGELFFYLIVCSLCDFYVLLSRQQTFTLP